MDHTAGPAYSKPICRRWPGASCPHSAGTSAKNAVCLSLLAELAGRRRRCSCFWDWDLAYLAIRDNIRGFHSAKTILQVIPPTQNIRANIQIECSLVQLSAYSVWACFDGWPYRCDISWLSSTLHIAVAFFFHPTAENHQLEWMSPLGSFVANSHVTDSCPAWLTFVNSKCTSWSTLRMQTLSYWIWSWSHQINRVLPLPHQLLEES